VCTITLFVLTYKRTSASTIIEIFRRATTVETTEMNDVTGRGSATEVERDFEVKRLKKRNAWEGPHLSTEASGEGHGFIIQRNVPSTLE